jgi:hypothetical protein
MKGDTATWRNINMCAARRGPNLDTMPPAQASRSAEAKRRSPPLGHPATEMCAAEIGAHLV